jgi:hypothetical protein
MFVKGSGAAVAVEICLEARNFSRYRISITCRCGCLGLDSLRICLRGRSKSKNCDELINYTVRVMLRLLLKFSRKNGICLVIKPNLFFVYENSYQC